MARCFQHAPLSQHWRGRALIAIRARAFFSHRVKNAGTMRQLGRCVFPHTPRRDLSRPVDRSAKGVGRVDVGAFVIARSSLRGGTTKQSSYHQAALMLDRTPSSRARHCEEVCHCEERSRTKQSSYHQAALMLDRTPSSRARHCEEVCHCEERSRTKQSSYHQGALLDRFVAGPPRDDARTGVVAQLPTLPDRTPSSRARHCEEVGHCEERSSPVTTKEFCWIASSQGLLAMTHAPSLSLPPTLPDRTSSSRGSSQGRRDPVTIRLQRSSNHHSFFLPSASATTSS